MTFPGDAVWTFAPRWEDLPEAGQVALLAALLMVPAGLILWWTRPERRLVRRWQAGGLALLRLAVVGILWLAVALRPTLVRTSAEEIPDRVRVAVDLSASMEVHHEPRTPEEKRALAQALKLPTPESVAALSRRQIVERVLAPEGMDLLGRLARQHRVELVGFDRQARPGDPEHWRDLAAPEQAPPRAARPAGTDLGVPLAHSTSHGNEPLRGIVLLTDGRHNVGPPPLELATRLGQQGTPVYAVAVGASRPPSDLAIVDLEAPEKTFKGLRVPVTLRVRATRLPAQELTVELQVDGKVLEPGHQAVFKHDGTDQTYVRTFDVLLADPGIRSLTAQARAAQLQCVRRRPVLVGTEPVRVLLVDGEARWEYHYLAATLARDPRVRLERVLFEQPRLGLLKEGQLETSGLPRRQLPARFEDDVDPLLGYDCILLGDVAPERLPPEDRRRLAGYVAARGGTLVLVAGHRYLPLAYTGAPESGRDPLVKLFPFVETTILQPATGFRLRLTPEGRRTAFLQLEPDEPGEPWDHLPKHYWGIAGQRKPGASVLAVAGDAAGLDGEAAAGLFIEQRYGVGRVVYLGVDSTWRWRSFSGDVHYHRFWGQLLLWAAADKLLPAGNDQVRYGTRAFTYLPGDGVDVLVRIGESLPARATAAGAQARLVRTVDGAAKVEAVVPLAPSRANGRLLEGRAHDLPPGEYHLGLDLPGYRDRRGIAPDPGAAPLFRVLPAQDVELADVSVDHELLQSLAGRSEGRLLSVSEADQVVELLARRTVQRELRAESRPWQDPPLVWWALGTVLALLTLEWGWRRWLELP